MKKNIWNNNRVQFMRLLAEMQGAIKPETIRYAATNMDLHEEDIVELLDRAVYAWEDYKNKMFKTKGKRK